MKRATQFILALALAASAHATDRVVSPNGIYNTISSAIAASSAGDRVLISPGIYNEYVTVRNSISLLPLVEGSRYTLSQKITVDGANGSEVLISGAKGTTIVLSGTYSARTTISVVDSYFDGCDLVDPHVRVELIRDTLVSSAEMSSCLVAGCSFIGGFMIPYTLSMVGNTVLPDVGTIVGNDFGSVSGDGDLYLSTMVPIRIENNFFRSNQVPVLNLIRSADMLGSRSHVLNNTFHTTMNTGAGAFAISLIGTYSQELVVKNNATVGYGGGTIDMAPSGTALEQSNNVIAQSAWIDPATGAAMSGSPLIDAGDPDPRYLDLDLTVNDAGCYGGSNSRENFTTPMGSAVVGFMQAPRVVAQGEPVNIQATGFDR